VQQGLEKLQHEPQAVQAPQLALCLRMHFHCPLLGWDQNLNTRTTRKILQINCRSDKLQIFISCSLFVYNFTEFINTHPLHRLSIYLWLYSPLLEPGHFFSFLILCTGSTTPWTGDQSITRLLLTHRTQTQNKCTQTSMSYVGIEPMIPAFVSKDSSGLRLRCHCDQHCTDCMYIYAEKKMNSSATDLLM
jgi:hypothetical protein